jgi:hypothetical protein
MRDSSFLFFFLRSSLYSGGSPPALCRQLLFTPQVGGLTRLESGGSGGVSLSNF